MKSDSLAMTPHSGSETLEKDEATSAETLTSKNSNQGLNLTEAIQHLDSFEVPSLFLNQGMLLLKISHKSKKRIIFWVDPENFKFFYRQVSRNAVNEFYVDDIRSITSKDIASHYREELGISKEFEQRWISVTYFNQAKNKLKNLHLIADTNHDQKKLLEVMNNFKKMKDEISSRFLLELKDLDDGKRHLLKEKAESAEKSQKMSLSFLDVLKYCRRLNINLDKDRLKGMFNNSSKNGEHLDFEEFKNFVNMLTDRKDLRSICSRDLQMTETLTFDQFVNFIRNVQKETMNVDECRKIFRKFAGSNDYWTTESLNSYLMSKYSSFTKERFRESNYYHRPLNEYFILSSHNTYLTGRQVGGDSSVEGYVRALQRGCRCLEIDIWNNEEDPTFEPIVNHGRTFTTGISLSNVLRTIKKYAFYITQYPLILSLEIRCSYEAQLKVAQFLREIFGDTLITQPITTQDILPSPDELKGRILIKVKKTTVLSNSGEETGRSSTSTTATSVSESNESITSTRRNSLKLRRRSSNKISSTLSELGVYCQGIKFRNFSLPESKTYNHCFSLSEKSINSMLKDRSKAESVDKHNTKYLMRVYPSKYRITSSNLLPMNYWKHGVQMVATNWQTYDLGQQINESYFDTVQGRGYILKPSNLRKAPVKAVRMLASKESIMTLRFSIEVISAQKLPRVASSESLNPFVVLEIIGVESITWDEKSTVGATQITPGNGFNPVWNAIYSGVCSVKNELLFLRVTIHTSASTNEVENSREIGILIVNFFDLKQGFRYIPLKDLCGEQLLYSSIFMKIDYGYT